MSQSSPPPDEVPFSAPGFGAPDIPASSRDFAVLPQPAEPASRIREHRVNTNPFEQIGPRGPVDPFGNPYGFQSVPAYASWGLRLVSYLFDAIVVAVPMTFLTGRLGSTIFFSGRGDAGNTLRIFLIALASMVNLGVLQGKTGQSIGKRILSLKVVDQSTGLAIGIKRGVLRWFASVVMNYLVWLVGFVVFLPVGVLWLVDHLFPLWDPKKQSIHDKVAKSIVIGS